MTVGKTHLGQAATRRVFLKALAAHGNIGRAAKAAEVTRNAVNYQRFRYPDFDTAVRGALPPEGEVKSWAAWTAARKAAFLEALAMCGNAAQAATACGGSEGGAYRQRSRDSDFAAAWMEAKRQAFDRVDDVLFDGALNGFVTTRTDAGGSISTTRWQSPQTMLRLVERRPKRTPGVKYMEMNQAQMDAARARLDRKTAHAMDEAIVAYRAGLPIPYPQPSPYWFKPGLPHTPNALYTYSGTSRLSDSGPVLAVTPPTP